MTLSLKVIIERSLIHTYITAVKLKTSCKESVVSSLNRAYPIITNKYDLTKENANLKQMLKENGYQESIISEIFKRITNDHSLSPSQQQTQVTDIQEAIRISINSPYVEDRKNYCVFTRKTIAYTQILQNKIHLLLWN